MWKQCEVIAIIFWETFVKPDKQNPVWNLSILENKYIKTKTKQRRICDFYFFVVEQSLHDLILTSAGEETVNLKHSGMQGD